jgi:ATP/maltotriose-dependent transcriptional regulator MalT
VLKAAGLLTWRGGDDGRAEALANEARALLEELGDDGELVGALSLLGAIEHSRGAFEPAQALYEATVDLAQRSGRPFERALVLNNLASIAMTSGELERSQTLYLGALEEAVSIDATELAAFSTLGLTRVARHLERPDESARRGVESLELFARLRFRDRMATCCIYLADVLDEGRAMHAAELLGAASALRSGTGAAPDTYEQEVLDAVTARLRERLGDGFDDAYRAGAGDADRVVASARASRSDLRPRR